MWPFFTIITDHKPLLQLLGPSRPVPVQAAARLQRWALILASYDYKLEYRCTSAHADADSMSRLPLSDTWSPKGKNVECLFFDTELSTNVTHILVKKQTSVDPVLSKVYRYTMDGWPSVVDDPNLGPFKTRKDKLNIEQGCVLWGIRVIVPSILQKTVLEELHETHPGSQTEDVGQILGVVAQFGLTNTKYCLSLFGVPNHAVGTTNCPGPPLDISISSVVTHTC